MEINYNKLTFREKVKLAKKITEDYKFDEIMENVKNEILKEILKKY